MSLISRGFVALLLAPTAITACAATVSSPPVGQTPVEVWRGGDDGLTSHFADALEEAFRASSEFALSTGKVPGTLVVTIPTNLTWKQVAGRNEVTYLVQFTGAASEPLGSSSGNCGEEQLQQCVAHVLLDARAAKSKLGQIARLKD